MRRIRFTFAVLILIASGREAFAEIATPMLTSPPTSNTGYAQLRWTVPDSPATDQKPTYELQSSASGDFSDFETLYKGSHHATFLSGLTNGTYHFRVRTIASHSQSRWSEAQTLRVQHFDPSTAWAFFIIGLAVFMAIAAVIVKGHRSTASE